MPTPTPETTTSEAPTLAETIAQVFAPSQPEEGAIFNDWRHVAFVASIAPDEPTARPFSSWEVDTMGEKGKKNRKVEYIKFCMPVFAQIKG